MKYQFRLVFLSLLLFCISGCGAVKTTPKSVPMMTTADVVKSVVMEYEAAVNSGNLDDLIALYAGNAVQAAPNERAINGAQAIRMRAESNHEVFAYNLKSIIDDIQVSGDLATVRTTFSETMTSKTNISDTTTTTGVWVLLLQQQPAGNWKIVTEIWNDEKPIEALAQ